MEANAEQVQSVLVVDVGNTVAKVAIFRAEELLAVYHTDNTTLAGVTAWAEQYGCKAGILSTVVDLSDEAEQVLAALPFDLLRLSGNTPLPIQSEYAANQLGTDRIAAVVAVADSSCDLTLIADLGTCITYDWVLGTRHLGGNISPGVDMRFKAMHDYTSRLPMLALGNNPVEIGKTTEDAMRSGVFFGISQELLGYIMRCVQGEKIVRLVVTGGDTHYIETQLKAWSACEALSIELDADLVLKGLNRILLYNGTH